MSTTPRTPVPIAISVWVLCALLVLPLSAFAMRADGFLPNEGQVDALKVIGLNPIGVLVFPRLVALVKSGGKET